MDLKAMVALFNGGCKYQLPERLCHILSGVEPGRTTHVVWGGKRRQVVRDRTGVVRIH